MKQSLSQSVKKPLTLAAGFLVMLGLLAIMNPAYPHERDRGDWHNLNANHQHKREAIQREREETHREFDAMLQDVDREGMEIDRWQSRQQDNHQEVSRIARQKREALNRERARINRDRVRMNRYYDEQHRKLDERYLRQQQRWNDRRS